MSYPRDLASCLAPAFAFDIAEITAGGGADGVAVNGETIDRERAQSACLLIQADATLGGGETLGVTLEIQDSADGSTFEDVDSDFQPSGNVLSLAATGKTAAKVGVDLSPFRRYVRFKPTPTLSAGSTDTAKISAVCALGGLVIERGQ